MATAIHFVTGEFQLLRRKPRFDRTKPRRGVSHEGTKEKEGHEGVSEAHAAAFNRLCP
jgi:hypothetical protein